MKTLLSGIMGRVFLRLQRCPFRHLGGFMFKQIVKTVHRSLNLPKLNEG